MRRPGLLKRSNHGRKHLRAGNALPPWVILLLIGLIASSCRKEESLQPEQIRQILSCRNLGLAYLEENRLEEAGTEFKKIIDMAPQEALGYADLGLTYLRLGRYAEGEAEIKKALQKSSEPGIRLILAEILERS